MNCNEMTPKLITLTKFEDPRGNLTFLEQHQHIPFEIKRVYWIYDVPGGQVRGGHAFIEQEEVIVALSGSFDVVIHDGTSEQKYHLNRSYVGLYVPKMIWRHLENFSTNSIMLSISSTNYEKNDYVRDFEIFLKKIYEKKKYI
jgi:hypothetical protein